ncbi:EAL domain-containing protein [Rhodoferax sp. PAMC 29310]|uniref:EAL domain-containing protein n=1 Tax=Rhodoferax sp. PAMC 29310 TaxID=2822760 RepID=UPI001F0B56D8|nr:EAL domain-containing protein [Rhodoferax sp. PAMC 29310]
MSPVTVAPGVILDARSAVMGMTGLFGGPLVALISALIGSGFRFWIGGVGALVGALVILASAALGLLYRRANERRLVSTRAVQLLCFGVLLQLAELLFFTLLPGEAQSKMFEAIDLFRIASMAAIALGLGVLLKDGVLRQEVNEALKESEARFRNLLQDIPGVSVQGYSPDGTTIYWNNASQTVYGYSREEAIGKNLLDLIIPPEMHEGVRQAMTASFQNNIPIPAGELPLRRKDGSTVPVFSSHALVRPRGGPPEMFCIDIDLTERHRAQEELRVAATAFEAQDGIAITDPKLTILRVNKAFTDLLGQPAEAMVGKALNDVILISEQLIPNFYATLDLALQDQVRWTGEIELERADKGLIPVYVGVTSVSAEGAEVSHFVVTVKDISQRKEAEAQIRQLAFFDSLTDLPNRRLLMDRLTRALVSSERNQTSGAIFFIDLDHFKTLNDTLGHEKGDELLQQVGDRLLKCVRETDTVARLGGDEFVLMLEGLDGRNAAADARSVGCKIMSALGETYPVGNLDYHSTPSIGVALFRGAEVPMEELLKQADVAMYQAKAAGRNTLQFFDPAMQAAINERATLENDLRLGLEGNQFTLFYQSQVNAMGQICGAEALVRWNHPARGMVSPAHFIPLAEETGLILPLGAVVLKQACLQLVDWAKRPSCAHLFIAVNVSAREFKEKDFAQNVLSLIEKTGANPCRLKLELTESMLAANLDDVIVKMNRLRQSGLQFSLDDFGTCYSSLSYLKMLPLSQLKIDQSFVRDVLTDPNDAVIAKTIITLGHSLGLKVIAEGVETKPQRAFLAQHGCLDYQGYLFSRPLSIDAFEKLLGTKDAVAPAS